MSNYPAFLACMCWFVACTSSRQRTDDSARETMDSARVVMLADRAYRAIAHLPDSSRIEVLSFMRDGNGYIVELAPALHRDLTGTGGGARIRVAPSGKATVLGVLQ
jgi:hypothetical protein